MTTLIKFIMGIKTYKVVVHRIDRNVESMYHAGHVLLIDLDEVLW